MSQTCTEPGRFWCCSLSPDTSHSIPSLASSDPHDPSAETLRFADTVDTACPPSRSPTQGHLLSQGGDPGSRSPGVLPTLLEIIQADRWVLEIIRHGYSIELIRNTPPPLKGLQVLSNKVEDLLWKGAVVPTPRPGEE